LVIKSRLKYILLITLLVFSFACERKPEGVIDKKQLVPIMVDLHKVHSIVRSQTFTKIFYTTDSVKIYEPVFEKYGVTREQFEKSIQYYSAFPSEFDLIYEEVIAELTREQNYVSELIAEAAKDTTLNLWPGSMTRSFSMKSSASELAVNVPVKGSGHYTFSSQIRLYKDDESVDPTINLWFWYDDGSELGVRDSFPTLKMNKDGKLHFYNIKKELTDTLVTHIKGFLFDYSNNDTLVKRHADFYQIRISFEELIPAQSGAGSKN
jgi:hypothetical protein